MNMQLSESWIIDSRMGPTILCVIGFAFANYSLYMKNKNIYSTHAFLKIVEEVIDLGPNYFLKYSVEIWPVFTSFKVYTRQPFSRKFPDFKRHLEGLHCTKDACSGVSQTSFVKRPPLKGLECIIKMTQWTWLYLYCFLQPSSKALPSLKTDIFKRFYPRNSKYYIGFLGFILNFNEKNLLGKTPHQTIAISLTSCKIIWALSSCHFGIKSTSKLWQLRHVCCTL